MLRRADTSVDARRQQRLDLVLGLAEQFVHDLGLLMAGEGTGVDAYVARDCAQRLRTALAVAPAPLRLTPHFGEYAQVRIDGDLLDEVHPVRATVEFVDLSVPPVSSLPPPRPRPRRRVRVRLVLDGALTTVLDHRVELA